MKIYNSSHLKDLQKEFNQVFTYLKIEFFKTPYQEGEGSNEVDILNLELTVGEVNPTVKDGKIPLKGTMHVGEFEKLFDKHFGLSVQVYRKSHGKWLQTWVTDIWTLDEQNNRGKIMGDIDN
jgi:hypothetical protein